MRKYARKVARKRMELRGIQHPCRTGKNRFASYFSMHWREYVKKRNGQMAA